MAQSPVTPGAFSSSPVEALVSCDDYVYKGLKGDQANFDKEMMTYVRKHSKTKLTFTSNFKQQKFSTVELKLVTTYSISQHPELPWLGRHIIYDFLKEYFETKKYGFIKIKFDGVAWNDLIASVVIQESKDELTVIFKEEHCPTSMKKFHQLFSVALSVDFDEILQEGTQHGDSQDIKIKDIEIVHGIDQSSGVKKVVVQYDYSGPMDFVMRKQIIDIVDESVEQELFPYNK